MEIYETLFTDELANCEPGDLISIDGMFDGETVNDVIRIKNITVGPEIISVYGYSEVLNDSLSYEFPTYAEVEVLGG